MTALTAEPGQGSALDPAPVPDTSTAERRPQAAPVDGTGGPAAPGATPGPDDATAAVSEPPADEQPEPNQHSAPVAVTESVVCAPLIEVDPSEATVRADLTLAFLLDLNPVEVATYATVPTARLVADLTAWCEMYAAARKEMAA